MLLGAVLIVFASLTPLEAQIIYQQPPSASTATFAVYDTVPRILADDFPITQTTEVTDLHVFGSWLGDNLPVGGFSDVNFALSLHNDNGLSPGLPMNPPIWQSTAPPTPMAASFVATTSGQGFFDPATSSFIGTTNTIYEYNFTLTTPVTLTPGTYWLDVQAQPGPTANGVLPIFGWDTTLPVNNFGSDAAWGNAPYGSYPPTWTSTGVSAASPGFGLAFAITGKPTPEPSTLALAGMALIGLLGFAHRRASNRRARLNIALGLASFVGFTRKLMKRNAQRVMAVLGIVLTLAWETARKQRLAALLMSVAIVCASLTPLKAQIIYQQPPSASTATFAVYDTVPRILADDFPITQTTEVTDLHVFGSWLNDNLPAAGFSDVNFALSLHTDNGLSPGLPVNPPIWQSTAPPTPMAASFVATTLGQAFFDPATSSFIGTTNTIYEYNFTLLTPVTLTPGTYWLDVQAQPGPSNNGVTPIFGWDTTLPANNFGSEAAWGNAAYGSYPPTWTPTGPNPLGPGFGLAFAITGKPTPEPSTLCLAGMALIGLLGFAHRHASNRRARLNIALGLASFVGFTRKLAKSNARRAVAILGTALTLAMTRGAMAVNLVSNGEFSQFTQGHPNEFMADTNTAPDAMLTDWSNNRPFVAIYGPHASELIGATGPSYSGTIWLWGPLNGSNNGFTDTSPNQASDPTANFLAADADPTFFGTGISQTISTPLVTGQQYTLSYYWGAIQDEGDFGPTHSGWTVTLGTQQIVDGNTVFASIPSQGFSGWNLMSTTFTYSGGSSDLLSFLVVGGPSGLPPVALLDSVSLVKASAPEPSTMVLMGVGLLSVVAIKLHRRRSTQG